MPVDLHIATETRPGPPGFFDHPLWITGAVIVGCALGIAIMMATTTRRTTLLADPPSVMEILVTPDSASP